MAGIFGLIIGLPALLYQLFVQTFSGRNPGKLGDLLPIGLLLSLAGYGLIRNDRFLQFVALALSLAFLAVAGVGYARCVTADDTFHRFLIPAIYCVVSVFVGRKPRELQQQVGQVSSEGAPFGVRRM